MRLGDYVSLRATGNRGGISTALPEGFELTNQNSVLCKYSFPKVKVIAMTVADRKGSEQLEPWITNLCASIWKPD